MPFSPESEQEITDLLEQILEQQEQKRERLREKLRDLGLRSLPEHTAITAGDHRGEFLLELAGYATVLNLLREEFAPRARASASARIASRRTVRRRTRRPAT